MFFPYVFSYFLLMCVWQLFLSLIWKKTSGIKLIMALSQIGRLHLLLLLIPAVFLYLPIRLSLKIYFAYLLIVLSFFMDALLWFFLIRACRTFRKNLRADDKIIIIGQTNVRMLWNPFFRIPFIALFGALKEQEYWIIPEIIALAFRRQLLSHPVYILFHPLLAELVAIRALKKKKPLAAWETAAEQYILFHDPQNQNLAKQTPALGRLLMALPKKPLPKEDYPFPHDKILYLHNEDLQNGYRVLADIIRLGSRIHEKILDNLLPHANHNSSEIGKCYLSKMILNLSKERQSSTGYFYDIMKLAEFMMHYLSLADYEKAQKNFFATGKAISLGTFQEGIVEEQDTKEETFQPKDKDAYIEALKYLNQVCTNIKGSISRKELYKEGRQKLVMVRNHFMHQGTLTYGITAEFVEQLLLVVIEQTAAFMKRKEPMMPYESIDGIPKYRYLDKQLYLLIQLENGCKGKYLDYASGRLSYYPNK